MKFVKLLLVFLSVTLLACKDDPGKKDNPENGSELEVTFICELPEGVEEGTLSNIVLTMKEVNTGKEKRFPQNPDGLFCTAEVVKGFYNVSLEGDLTYSLDGKETKVGVKAYKEAIEVIENHVTVDLPLFMQQDPDNSGFVFAEIFFSGTATPQGTYYYADKYFVIYNNSDQTLYADSLAIVESNFLTTMKEDYNPDIRSQAMAVQAVYMIPGNGKDVPVAPGESLLVCDNAQNHQYANPNSWDLTKADFEWFDESTNPGISDIDNPDVPNLEKIYCSTLTLWSPHTQGFTSFGLVRMKTDKITFLTDYTYDYDYTVVSAVGEIPMTGSCYRVPNSWIVDAVNMSVAPLFQWIVVDPSLDQGWTYASEIGWDDSRYGKCVRRKVLSRTESGRAILKDTNNSTVDFDARQEADPFHVF